MFKFIIITFLSLMCLESFALKKKVNTSVFLHTNMGKIELELYTDKAPKTVENFMKYARSGHYDGTIFHRVIDNFMIQGGGYTIDLKEKPTRAPIKNEARIDLPNNTGTISMARTSAPHSATSQFFINVRDNSSLNFRSATNSGYGYAVFGRVKKGMSIVNRIKKAATKANGPHRNMPTENIIIKKVTFK